MLCQFLAAYLLLASSQDAELGESLEGDSDLEDILLLQVDIKLSRGLHAASDESLVSEGFSAADAEASESPALLSEIGFKSEAEGGVMFGPKTSAALFLLSSCTFGMICLCGAKPFITAPCLVRICILCMKQLPTIAN